MQLPPLNLNAHSGATSAMDMGASRFGASFGDWNVNVSGSGVSAQSASGGLNWWLIAAVAGAAWYLLRKRK